MGRKPNDLVWNCFTKLQKGSEKGVQCKYCQQKYTIGNVNKMKSHILKCLKSPLEIREEIAEAQSSHERSEKSLSTSASSEFDTPNTSESQLSENVMTSTPASKQPKLSQFVDKISANENVNLLFYLTIFTIRNRICNVFHYM